MNIKYTFIVIALFSIKISIGQTIYKSGIVELSDGSTIKCRIQAHGFEKLKDGCDVIVKDANKHFEVYEINSFIIDNNEYYKVLSFEKGYPKVYQVIATGDLNMYINFEGWIFLQKSNGEFVRLENHYTLVNSKGEHIKTDTLKREKITEAGKWKVRREYFYNMAKIFTAKSYSPPSTIKLSPRSIK